MWIDDLTIDGASVDQSDVMALKPTTNTVARSSSTVHAGFFSAGKDREQSAKGRGFSPWLVVFLL